VKRYEVWQLKPAPEQKQEHELPELVMVLQSERLDHLASVIVAPLQPSRDDLIVPSLTPSLEVEGERYTILIPLMAAIDKRDFDIRLAEGSLLSYEIDRAIDRLFMGI
jgi:hypothetical protein